MQVLAHSTCFCTTELAACKHFYQTCFAARVIFDCGWYITLEFGNNGAISFIQPQEGMAAFSGAGVMLNFKVEDVDAEYARLQKAGLESQMPLEDHPWGDRGFSVIDPIVTDVYIYSDREPADAFKPCFNA